MPISPIPALVAAETIHLMARHGGQMPSLVGHGLEVTGSMPVTA
jgi:hypothetical protein